MNVNTFILFYLLLNLCAIFGMNKNKAPKRVLRRRYNHGGRQQVGYVSRKSAKLYKPRHSNFAAKVPNIIADESTLPFIDSYISVDEVETGYHILPGRQGSCKANGMIMYHNAVWSPKPCLTCLCSSGKIVCDEMNCPILKCARTIIPTGECCSICTSDGNSITAIPAEAFNGIPNLELIDLSRNRITLSNIDHAAFKRLKKLERLYLDGNLLLQIPPQLPRTLVELKVNENLLQRLDEQTFHGLSKIVNLELEGNKLSESNVQPLVFRPLKRLAYLRLGKNKFRTLPQGLPPSIEELYLEHNEIEEISEMSLNKTTNLNVIVLRNNKLDEARIAPMAWIKLENLESLDLSYNKIVHVPSFLPKGLLYLILVHNQIERIPGFVFAHMEPGLEILYLSFNKLTSGEIDPVSFFGTYDSMRELFLDHNLLKRVPAGIAEMKALHFLRLNDNIIRNIQLESICSANDDDDSNIRTLHLENNYINTRRIPPTAFSCIQLYSAVVLSPQKVKK